MPKFWPRGPRWCLLGLVALSAGNLKAAELSGTIRYDGPLKGNIIVQAWQPRPANHALQLDGKTGYVITQLTDLSGSELTLQFWFKGTSIQSAIRQQNGGLQDFQDEWNGRTPTSSHNPPRGWIVAGWHGFHLLSHDGLLNGIYYDPDIIDDRWHHVAMTWKQNTKDGFRSYVDGMLFSKRDTCDLPIPNYNSPVYFGSFGGGSEFTAGMIDEISIWRRALPEKEINDSWHQVLSGNEPGLVGLWNFEDLTPDDCSSNHFHGQLRGAAAIVDTDVLGLGAPVVSTTLVRPGEYQLNQLLTESEYSVVAFLDVNANRVMDPWEPRSAVTRLSFRAHAKPMVLDLPLGIPVPFWRSSWFLALAGFVLLSAVASLFWLAQTRKLRRRFEELQRQHQLEHERGRIARDIHDELGAKLSRISYLSEVAKGGSENGGRAELESLGTATRDLLKTLDTIVWAVTPQYDTLENLVEYTCQSASEFFSMTGVDCQVSIPDQLPDQVLTSQVRHEVFRVIQESLNNILKHANASKVNLKFELRDSNLSIAIVDNGNGFDLGDASGRRACGGNGLRNMRERMSDLGGGLEIFSTPGQGTTVFLVLPLTRPNPPELSAKAAASANTANAVEKPTEV